MSPRLAPTLLDLAREGRLCWQPQEYVSGDASSFARVVAATGGAAVDTRVLAGARERGLPATPADVPPIAADHR